MSPIRQLDERVVALIAAGEVVERPVSAVKELAENAIDAGATAVTVEVRRGGFDLVRVRDDGAGIDAADLPLALARHATSKLRLADDLFDVRSLGFRGEALASIAAVSRLRLVTRTAGAASGRVLAATAGTIDEDGAVAATTGTTVSVEDLFFNVPARHAFQRSPAGETRAIVHLVTQLALAAPGVRWRVVVDGRDVLAAPGGGSLREALVAVHGPAIAPHVLDVPGTGDADGLVTVSGVVTSPAVHRNVRTYCTFIVNGRVVRNQALAHAVEEAYHALLPHGRHPVAAIRVEVPPSEVDVNVHPTKLEVRLRRERLAFARVRDGVRRALAGYAPSPTVEPVVPSWPAEGVPAHAYRPRAGILLDLGRREAAEEGALGGARAPDGGDALDDPFADLAGADPDMNPREARTPEPWRPPVAPASPPPGATARADGVGAPARPASDPATWRPLGQVGLTYVVVEAPDGMYLIDQHSAHERVQYEALKAATTGDERHAQPLLVPEAVDLSPAQAAWLRGHLHVLATFGYELEPFGGGSGPDGAGAWSPESWLVRAVPSGVARRGRASDVAALVDGLVDREYGDGPIEDQARWAVACHASVRAGDRLSMPEMQSLLAQLSRCDLRQTCPHGRPTMIHLSHSQLAREFGRSAPVRSSRYG